MKKKVAANYSSNRLILKNVFLLKKEKSQPVLSIINLELYNNGLNIYNISPEKDEAYIVSYQSDDLDYELIPMRNGVFDGLKIHGNMYFIVLKKEARKIESFDMSSLLSLPQDVDYIGENLCEANEATAGCIKKLTSDIKNSFFDVFGFPKLIDTGAINRLVLIGAYHYDQKYKNGSFVYCNLEIFQNGSRRFEESLVSQSIYPDDLEAVYQLLPLSSGNFHVLIIKDRRKTDKHDIFLGKDFYLIPNQEVDKFRNIDIGKDLYKLDPDEDMAESDNYYEGQELEITRRTTSFGNAAISQAGNTEFQLIIQNI